MKLYKFQEYCGPWEEAEIERVSSSLRCCLVRENPQIVPQRRVIGAQAFRRMPGRMRTRVPLRSDVIGFALEGGWDSEENLEIGRCDRQCQVPESNETQRKRFELITWN